MGRLHLPTESIRQIGGQAKRRLPTLLALKWKSDLAERTYYWGMSELLEKGFLFRSMAADIYFVNVRFMFNGDRMALVQSYRRKGKTGAAAKELPSHH